MASQRFPRDMLSVVDRQPKHGPPPQRVNGSHSGPYDAMVMGRHGCDARQQYDKTVPHRSGSLRSLCADGCSYRLPACAGSFGLGLTLVPERLLIKLVRARYCFPRARCGHRAAGAVPLAPCGRMGGGNDTPRLSRRLRGPAQAESVRIGRGCRSGPLALIGPLGRWTPVAEVGAGRVRCESAHQRRPLLSPGPVCPRAGVIRGAQGTRERPKNVKF